MLSSGEQCSAVSLKVGPYSLQPLNVAHINTTSQRCCSVFQTGFQLLRGSVPGTRSQTNLLWISGMERKKKTPNKNPMSSFRDLNKIESMKSWDCIWHLSPCFDKPLDLANTLSCTEDSVKLHHIYSQKGFSDQLYS